MAPASAEKPYEGRPGYMIDLDRDNPYTVPASDSEATSDPSDADSEGPATPSSCASDDADVSIITQVQKCDVPPLPCACINKGAFVYWMPMGGVPGKIARKDVRTTDRLKHLIAECLHVSMQEVGLFLFEGDFSKATSTHLGNLPSLTSTVLDGTENDPTTQFMVVAQLGPAGWERVRSTRWTFQMDIIWVNRRQNDTTSMEIRARSGFITVERIIGQVLMHLNVAEGDATGTMFMDSVKVEDPEYIKIVGASVVRLHIQQCRCRPFTENPKRPRVDRWIVVSWDVLGCSGVQWQKQLPTGTACATVKQVIADETPSDVLKSRGYDFQLCEGNTELRPDFLFTYTMHVSLVFPQRPSTVSSRSE